MNSPEFCFLGLGKTIFNSNVGFVRATPRGPDIELLLSERLNRKKDSGSWPETALQNLQSRHALGAIQARENRDVLAPAKFEEYLNQRLPFFEHLQSQKLQNFSSHFNPAITWASHHLCHASAAGLMSPFENALIVVIDGAGSYFRDFPSSDPEASAFPPQAQAFPHLALEEISVYAFNKGSLRCLDKKWQVFTKSKQHPDQSFSEGLGSLYEKIAEFIFQDKRAAGKVMGLAPFGRAFPIRDRFYFQESLEWSKAYRGKSKSDWEKSAHGQLYRNLAATVQKHFEESLDVLLNDLKKRFPEFDHLILTGGCALNCTNNMKIVSSGRFQQIYVPPFPGDESIGLGAASIQFLNNSQTRWQPWPWERQNGYFGSPDSVPSETELRQIFHGYDLQRPESIERWTAQQLRENKIIGWFQGRSETGPRALGNRSLLARVDQPGIKNRLNTDIKMRESFRPYGCSVPIEVADTYFEVPAGFENPFMSFAVKVREPFQKLLAEATHIDGTSRMQTVHESQNPRFHRLLKEMENQTGLAAVLNTSLNVMGEPIVESAVDALHFLLQTPVDALVIGDFFVRKARAF